jgi:drug/metabolite transporter (DMT)-like permease
MVAPWLWIVFTVAAALLQTIRNALQRGLTGPLGAQGATFVRFFYGLPFGIACLAAILVFTGSAPVIPGLPALIWTIAGALSQIGATLLLLLAMRDRSFVVVTAYSKTEPVQVAIFGLVLLGDHLTLPVTLAIIVSTVGVVLMSWPRQGATAFGWRAGLFGIGSAALFGIASVSFRGAILTLEGAGYLVAASTILALNLLIQTVVFSAWLLLREPATFRAVLREWRPSLPAGLAGALASEGWFLAFALESAARVRTLALIEILFAQALAYRLFRQNAGVREWLGIALIVGGVIWLLNG